MDRDHLLASQIGLAKADERTDDGGAAALVGALESVTGPLLPGATILDFGCGIGRCVGALLDRGFDAYGVDVYEYWGRDRELYWETGDTPVPRKVTARLRLATLSPYALPFEDGSFDHIISTQVLEHVDDLEAVFGEIARTLRPGGTSLHVFPGRWVPPIEAHIGVPFPVLCHKPAYLKAMAVLGIRGDRQRGLKWKDVYRANREQMGITHYPHRHEVIRKAKKAGLDACYVEDSVNVRPAISRLHRGLTAIGMPALAKNVVMMLQQHRLLLSRPGGAEQASSVSSTG
jgi:SAM-dependent methyltransferase